MVNSSSKDEYGLTTFTIAEDYDIDIVAVHGLGGDRENTWTHPVSNKLWLRDFLPLDLQDLLKVRVMSFGYNATTAFSQAVTGVDMVGEALLAATHERRRSTNGMTKPIIFICHSLGGIIVKKALILANERRKEYESLLKNVRGVVFFAVPHRGSDIASLGKMLANILRITTLGWGVNPRYVNALKRNSRDLDEISKQFAGRWETLQVQTFYETMKMKGRLVVDETSARLNIPQELTTPLLGTDHVSICKFFDKESQNYKLVLGALRKFVGNEDIRYNRVSHRIVAFIEDEVGQTERVNQQDQRFEPLAPSPLIGSPAVAESNTKDPEQYTHGIRFQIVDKSTQKFSLVDKGFVDPFVDKWAELSGTTLQLNLNHSGAYGSLLFKGKTTGEMFSVAAGMHSYHPWCDVLTDLEEGMTAILITQSYYKPRSARLSEYAMECKKTSIKATSVSLIISRAWDRTYIGQLTISDNSVVSGPGPAASGALGVVTVIQGQVDQSHSSNDVKTFPPGYKWFSETFKTIDFTRSEIRNALAQEISDLVSELEEADVLGAATVTELNHEESDLKKVDILLKEINARPRDAILIRSFQRAVARRRDMRGFLREEVYIHSI